MGEAGNANSGIPDRLQALVPGRSCMIPSATDCYFPDHTVTQVARTLQAHARYGETRYASYPGCLSTRSMWLEKASKVRETRSFLEVKQLLLYAAKSSSVL
jgi:hypothetical protein